MADGERSRYMYDLNIFFHSFVKGCVALPSKGMRAPNHKKVGNDKGSNQ